MIKVGITGQSGFIGSHLYNSLGFKKNKFERVLFKKEYFKSEKNLTRFVNSCDVIIHLAAVIKNKDKKILQDVNFELMKIALLA